MSKLLPFWIKVIRRTMPIYIVGYLAFGFLLFTFINNTIKSDATKDLNLIALDKKNLLNSLLQNAKQDVAILANITSSPTKKNAIDTLVLASTLQKKCFLRRCIYL